MGVLAFIYKFLVVVRTCMELEVGSQIVYLCSDLFLLQLVSFAVDSNPL